MKKKLKIVLIVGIILLIVVLGYESPDKKKLEELNNGAYSWIVCSIDCPKVISSVSGWTIDRRCLEKCDDSLNLNVSEEFLEENRDKLVVSSDELKACGVYAKDSQGKRSLLRYVQCLREILPELREKYS